MLRIMIHAQNDNYYEYNILKSSRLDALLDCNIFQSLVDSIPKGTAKRSHFRNTGRVRKS